MSILIGIDVGASHTEAALADESLQPCVRVTGPGAALAADSLRSSAKLVGDLVYQLLQRHGATLPDAVVVGAAGAGRQDIRTEFSALLAAELGRELALEITTDGMIALHDGFGHGPGIVICAGSGSIAYARDPAGRIWRVGGLGWQYGDQGSGYALGRAALDAVTQAANGCGPSTVLTDSVDLTAGSDSAAALNQSGRSPDRAAVTGIAHTVCEAARAGDAVANALVQAAAAELARHIEALVDRFPEQHRPAGLAFSGRLLSCDSPVRHELLAVVRERITAVRCAEGEVDPARGAVALAAELGHH
jgi:N-acetylglucosamine kinase-like BadF-type ATPase